MKHVKTFQVAEMSDTFMRFWVVFSGESSTYLMDHPLDEIDLPLPRVLQKSLRPYQGLGNCQLLRKDLEVRNQSWLLDIETVRNSKIKAKWPTWGWFKVDLLIQYHALIQFLNLDLKYVGIELEDTASQYEKSCILLKGSFMRPFKVQCWCAGSDASLFGLLSSSSWCSFCAVHCGAVPFGLQSWWADIGGCPS